MRPFQRGHVWLVNFDPSVGHEYQKVRPALIIQQNTYLAGALSLLTVIPISSQVIKRSELDLLVTPDSQNRLLKPSLLKTQQISSFDKRRFIKYIGTLNDDTLHRIDEQLQLFLFGKIFNAS